MGFETDKLKIDMLLSSTLAPRVNGLLDWSSKNYGKHFQIGDPITVGNTPKNIAYCPINNCMYISNNVGGTVSVVDCSTGIKITDVSVGHTPTGIAYCPTNNTMYVTNDNPGSVTYVSPINCFTNNKGTDIPHSSNNGNPKGCVYCTENNSIYSFGNFKNFIFQWVSYFMEIDCNDNSHTEFGSFNSKIDYIAYNPNNNCMYACDIDSTTIRIIDCNDNSSTLVSIPSCSGGIVYYPLTNKMYIGGYISDYIVYIMDCNTNTIEATTIIPGANFLKPIYMPSTNRIYFTADTSYLKYIDCTDNSVGSSNLLANAREGLAYCPVNDSIYCNGYDGAHKVYRIGNI